MERDADVDERASLRNARLHELYKNHPLAARQPRPPSAANPAAAALAQSATAPTAQPNSTTVNDADRANQRYAQLHELYKTHPRVGSEPPPLSTADPTVAGPAQTATSLTAQGISTQMTPDERAVLRNAKLHELYSKLDLPANAAAKTTTGVPAEPLSEGARTGTVIDAARLGSTIRQAQSYTDPSVAGPGGQRPVERGVGPSL